MANAASPHPPAQRSRSIGALHKDIEFANTYRLELIKTMLAIATALLAFTVSFRPRLTHVACESAMVLGWAGLAISLIAGLATMYGWERFYISYRDFDWKGLHDAGKAHRRTVNGWRKLAFALQCIGFLVGVAGVATFAALNVANVRAEAGE